MRVVTVVFYQDSHGCPVREWLQELSPRAFAKGVVRIERLAEMGHELRRPECDYLRDGIYELRWRLGHVNYRLLYFFRGQEAVVLAHGLMKEASVPEKDIRLAISRRAAYLEDPEAHTYYQEESL